MDDDFLDNIDVDDAFKNNKPKKAKVNGKDKGNRTELNLCKLLTDHFGCEFSKALGSGARWSQVNNLPAHARMTLTGDVCVPEHFRWTIESKGGYEKEVNLNNLLDGPVVQLDKFIEQCQKDAHFCLRKPIILWKRNRKPWLAIMRLSELPQEKFSNRMHYRHETFGDWAIVNFDELLKVTDRSYWFEK